MRDNNSLWRRVTFYTTLNQITMVARSPPDWGRPIHIPDPSNPAGTIQLHGHFTEHRQGNSISRSLGTLCEAVRCVCAARDRFCTSGPIWRQKVQRNCTRVEGIKTNKCPGGGDWETCIEVSRGFVWCRERCCCPFPGDRCECAQVTDQRPVFAFKVYLRIKLLLCTDPSLINSIIKNQFSKILCNNHKRYNCI